MFEDYLEDAYFFALEGNKSPNEREAKRYYRASIFYSFGAIEAFINYIGNAFAEGTFHPYEIAFLTDMKYGLNHGKFEILPQMDYHKLEDKLKYLIVKFNPTFDFEKTSSWSQIFEFKKLRDAITHPRSEEDEITIDDYRKKIQIGMSAIIEIMNYLCTWIFSRPLRKKLTDLIP